MNGNTYYSPHYDKHFLWIYKNASQTMKYVMEDHEIGNAGLTDSHKCFLIYRDPFSRWMSAINMVVDSGSDDIPESFEDPHFTFQKDCVSMIDVKLARVYLYNRNVVEEILIGEKMYRYWLRRHKRINPISQPELWHEPGVLEYKQKLGFAYVDEDHEKAYDWFKYKLNRMPENFLLHKTWEETVDSVMNFYEEDYSYFEGVKFVNANT